MPRYVLSLGPEWLLDNGVAWARAADIDRCDWSLWFGSRSAAYRKRRWFTGRKDEIVIWKVEERQRTGQLSLFDDIDTKVA